MVRKSSGFFLLKTTENFVRPLLTSFIHKFTHLFSLPNSPTGYSSQVSSSLYLMPISFTHLYGTFYAIIKISSFSVQIFEEMFNSNCTIQRAKIHILFFLLFAEDSYYADRADIAIVVDSSGSVTRRNYKLQKHIIMKIVGKIAPNVDKLSISLVSSSRGRVLFISDLNQFIQNGEDYLPHERGLSLINLPLNAVSREVFKNPEQNVSKITIVFADRFPRIPSNSPSVPVNKLRRKGVRIFVVAFGEYVPLNMLRTITESEEDLIFVWSLYTLLENVEYLVKMILHAIGKLEKKLN